MAIHMDRRPGWFEWDGAGLELDNEILYFSYGRMNLTRPAPRRALAVALHRDGVVDSSGDAYRLLEDAHVFYGQVTYVGEDRFLTYYEPDNDYEDVVDPAPATWVEINLGNQ